MTNKIGNVRINVTMWRVCVAILTVLKAKRITYSECASIAFVIQYKMLKAIRITYSECVFVPLVTQYKMLKAIRITHSECVFVAVVI